MGHIAILWKAVTVMKQDSSNLVLDFAAVYHCAIKPYKLKPQNRSVCTLLLGDKEYTRLPMSDAVCSNYINGKRTIPDNIRMDLTRITDEDLSKRLGAIGISDFKLPAEALIRLVERVNIPDSSREQLLTAYRNSPAITFINDVIHISANISGTHPLTQMEMNLLSSFSAPEVSLTADDDTEGTESNNNSDSFIPAADLDWMREYLPLKATGNRKTFLGTPVTITRKRVSLPEDFPALIYLLKPALQESPIDTFSYQDFVTNMGIDLVKGTLASGILQYWKLAGPPDGIAEAIKSLNLADVSDVVFLMLGKVTLAEARQIETSIKRASHSSISFLRALCYNEKMSEIEAILLTRVDPERASKLREYEEDEEGVKIAKLRR